MEPSLVDEALAEVREKMVKAIAHTQTELASVRTGRASASLLERIRVEYYGAEVPLQQLASFNVPEARLLVVSPFDKSSMRSIERAIQNSDLGITPSNDGQVIRLVFPQLTAERRRELVKVVRARAEDGKVALRNLRRATRHDLEGFARDGDISNDELDRAEKELERLTHEQVAEVDRILSHKEQELLEI